MTNYASYESKFAYLSSDFGRDYACKVFNLTPAELEAKVGRLSRGKRKGQLRGHIVWAKTTKGGWIKTGSYDHGAGQGNGFVAPPNLTFGHGVFANDKLILGVDMQAPRFDIAYAIGTAAMAKRGSKPADPAPTTIPNP